VAKFSPDGKLLWITYIGGACDDQGRGIAVDASGNVYIAGQLGFNCGEWRLQPGAFAAKLDPTGRGVYLYPFSGWFSGNDVGQAIAVDEFGAAYVTGLTNSNYFPATPNAVQPRLASVWLGNGFVVKINLQGNSLIYATYLGGSVYESANGIAVDGRGNAYITGTTQSPDFPTTANAFQRNNPSAGTSTSGFVSKLNADGSALVYSTYLGGRFNDISQGIAVDTVGNAYITGETESDDFPTTPGSVQPNPGDDRLCFYRLCTDAFVTKLNAQGSALVYSTYLGGNLFEGGSRIDVDTLGNAYLTGYTQSFNFPISQAFQPVNRGGIDAFVAKLNATGSALLYSSYLGGSDNDYGIGIAVDRNGNALVTGITWSTDFPTVNAQQGNAGGGRCWDAACSDVFVVRIAP